MEALQLKEDLANLQAPEEAEPVDSAAGSVFTCEDGMKAYVEENTGTPESSSDHTHARTHTRTHYLLRNSGGWLRLTGTN